MKKKISNLIVVAIAVLSLVGYNSCSDAKASKPVLIDSVQTSLSDYGFNNIPSEVNKTEHNLYSKTGLNFMSDDSITTFCRINGLIISDAQNFKAEIPAVNQRQIITSYAKLKDAKHYYFDNFWRAYCEVGKDHYGDKDPLFRKGIMVVAPAELFNSNAFINKDPIVLVKVDYGWLELTRW